MLSFGAAGAGVDWAAAAAGTAGAMAPATRREMIAGRISAREIYPPMQRFTPQEARRIARACQAAGAGAAAGGRGGVQIARTASATKAMTTSEPPSRTAT